ncbi:MAG: phosphoenolpyruvate--protein phosphotransferase [Planctomycetota bacterium]
MVQLQGIPVSPGVVIAPALVLDASGYQIPRVLVEASEADDEYARLRSAIDAATERLAQHAAGTAAVAGASTGNIFAAQAQMLADPRLMAELKRRVLEENQCADYAVSRVLQNYAAALRKLSNPLLAQRAQDVDDIRLQLLEALGAVQRQSVDDLDQEAVVFAHDLTPSETANLDRRYVRGFGTEVGGSGGHTAIVAKGLEIPAVVGVGSFLERVRTGDLTIVDGDRGLLVIRPDEETVEQYRKQLERRASLREQLETLRELPAETLDGVRVTLSANIEFPEEAASAVRRGGDGIGLYRTEFLYLARNDEPTEEDHYAAYRQVVEQVDGRPVVIRTLDLGADKMGHRPLAEQEHNPFLGLRSIRLSLRNLDLFRPQLRAILRAAAHGEIRIMFPLITTIAELRQARLLINLVAEDLVDEGIEHQSDIPIGIMVEVPATVMMLDHYIGEVDFFSIGTNDLAQYALAVDRSNEYVADLYQSVDPAVLRLISRCIDVAGDGDRPLSVCGEMSSMPGRAMLLLGMGIRHLSVPPAQLPKIKKIIRSVSIDQCREIASRALSMEAARDIDLYLLGQLEALVPEVVVR